MGTYDDALRDRLSQIDEMGKSQTTWEKLQAQRKASRKLFEQNQSFQRAQDNSRLAGIGNMAGIPGNVRQGAPSFSPGSNAFESFVNSIAKKESGGNYNAVNKYSGAMGKYQVMPSNIRGTGRGWDYEALGRDVTTSQYMASPEIQDQIARFKLQQYFNKYGAAGASVAWYAGPGAAAKYANTGRVSTNTQTWGFPSIASYMNSIMKGLK